MRTSPLTSAGRYGRVLVAMLAALVMLLAGALGTSGVDQADAAPRVVKMGALVTSLSDFDPADHSFRATFWLWTTVAVLGMSPMLLGPPRWSSRAQFIWAAGTELLARHVLGIRFRVRGREHIPAGAVIVACKHQSAYETIVMSLMLPNPAVVISAR